jgi:protein-tyrosine phosphatase
VNDPHRATGGFGAGRDRDAAVTTARGRPPTRGLALSGCCNFRDLGGYRGVDGRRTRRWRLFRADNLTSLTADDLVTVSELGIATVVDLRTELEVEARGRFSADVVGAHYHHLPLTDTLPGEERAAAWDDASFVAARYGQMLAEGAANVTRAVQLFASDVNLPAVFHCSVGKDRTGVLAAVLLGFVGVSDDDIVEDYALSRDAMAEVLERLRREFPDAVDVVERYAPVILSVEPKAMAGFLAEVHRRYGGFDGLAESLGVAEAVLALRDQLLEAPST